MKWIPEDLEVKDINEVYDKYGNGSKTYEEFLIKANIYHDLLGLHTIKEYFDKFNFLILLPQTNYLTSRNYSRTEFEIEIFRVTKNFERVIFYVNNYFDFYISTGVTNPTSLIIANRNGMAILNLNSVIDDFKILDLEEDDFNLLRRTLFEIKLM